MPRQFEDLGHKDRKGQGNWVGPRLDRDRRHLRRVPGWESGVWHESEGQWQLKELEAFR